MRQGIQLHRQIDSFAQNQSQFRESRHRISLEFGLYRGVLVDLFYDHFLAARWNDWSEEPLTDYLDRARRIIDGKTAYLPERLTGLVSMIFEELIPSYGEVEGIGRALGRMARRVQRPNPLAGGEEELVRHYEELYDDFRSFMPKAQEYASELILGNDKH